MWLVTTTGFYSVIRWHDGRMAIRARRRADLSRLKKLCPGVKWEGNLSPTPTKDYRYRLFCTPDEWTGIIAPKLAAEVDYGNFKAAVDRRHGPADVLSKACHAAWTVFGRMQPRGPYGSQRSGYPAVPKGELKAQAEADARFPAAKPFFGGGTLSFPPLDPDDRRLVAELDELGPEVCDECGDECEPGAYDVLGGRVLCRDVAKCVERSRVK